MRKILELSGGKWRKRTVVPELVVARTGNEQVMADGDGIELVLNAEVGTHSTLHRRLETGDGETESNGDRVDELPVMVDDANWSKEGWANQGLGDCLAVRDIYISDIEPVEEGTDAFGRVERSGSSESIGCYAHPDGRVAVVTVTVLDRLDRWGSVIVEHFFIAVVLSLVLVNLDLPVLPLVQPGESNKVDTGGLDLLVIE